MTRARRRTLVRVAGVLGVLSQLLVGLMAIFVFPAAFVSLATGAAGVRMVRRDREAAATRFGVALLASGVGSVLAPFSGALPMVVVALFSTTSFGMALLLVRSLEREARTAFGIRHRDWEQRNAELHQRREQLVDRPEPSPPAPAEPTAPGPPADEEAPWWEELQ